MDSFLEHVDDGAAVDTAIVSGECERQIIFLESCPSDIVKP